MDIQPGCMYDSNLCNCASKPWDDILTCSQPGCEATAYCHVGLFTAWRGQCWKTALSIWFSRQHTWWSLGLWSGKRNASWDCLLPGEASVERLTFQFSLVSSLCAIIEFIMVSVAAGYKYTSGWGHDHREACLFLREWKMQASMISTGS